VDPVWWWWALAVALIVIGVIGTFLPVLPGAALVFGGMLLAAWIDGFQRVGWMTLVILGVLTALVFAVDIVSGFLGAKRVGASKLAIVGAAIGTVVGLFFGIIGVLVALLVLYPALYSVHLATLNKSMERFVGFDNFLFLFKRETFWMVVQQSCIFAITAVIFKALIGFIVAHFVHNIPSRGQRKWRGMLLVPWVIPPAMSCLAWLWLFDPSYSALNWLLALFDIGPVPWTGEAYWARFSVILVNVWIGAPFFMIMYLAALKSVPEQLYEAAAIDGANWWQRMWYVTLPMMRNIMAITALFSLIVTFANFDIVRILTAGGPIDRTHVFATWAFWVGIQGNDIPLGASVSLFMVPILTVAAVFILRDINRRAGEMS